MSQGPARQDHFAQFGDYRLPPPRYKGTATRSIYVPMRDGVRLAVQVVLPRNLPPGEKIPALLSQTRYWRAIELHAPFRWFLTPEMLDPDFGNLPPFFTSHGYALVTVDVRGTGASFGAWRYPWSEDSIQDARQIVDWIVAQPWSDGQVAGYGISYLGTTAELLAVFDHPALKCTIPMFNHPDAYVDIAFPGGVFNERFLKAWGDMDCALDRNTIPRAFGLLGRLFMRGVAPVDGDRDRKHLEAAINKRTCPSVGQIRGLPRPACGGRGYVHRRHGCSSLRTNDRALQ